MYPMFLVTMALVLASCTTSCKTRQKNTPQSDSPPLVLSEFMLKAKDLASQNDADAVWVIDSYSGWSDAGGDILLSNSKGYWHAYRKANDSKLSELSLVTLSEDQRALLKKLSQAEDWTSDTFDGMEYQVYLEEKSRPARTARWNNPDQDSEYVTYVQLFQSLRR